MLQSRVHIRDFPTAKTGIEHEAFSEGAVKKSGRTIDDTSETNGRLKKGVTFYTPKMLELLERLLFVILEPIFYHVLRGILNGKIRRTLRDWRPRRRR